MTQLRSSLTIAGLGNQQILSAEDVDRLADGKHIVFVNKVSYEERVSEGSIIADPTPQIRVRIGNSDGGYTVFFPLQSYLKDSESSRLKAIAAGVPEADLCVERDYLCVVKERNADGTIKSVTRIADAADSDGMKFILRKLKGFFINGLGADEEELQPAENEDFIAVFERIAADRKENKYRFNVKLYKDKAGKVQYEKAWPMKVTVPAVADVEADDAV